MKWYALSQALEAHFPAYPSFLRPRTAQLRPMPPYGCSPCHQGDHKISSSSYWRQTPDWKLQWWASFCSGKPSDMMSLALCQYQSAGSSWIRSFCIKDQLKKIAHRCVRIVEQTEALSKTINLKMSKFQMVKKQAWDQICDSSNLSASKSESNHDLQKLLWRRTWAMWAP